MSRGRAVVVVLAFVASLLWVFVTPWCTRDRVTAPSVWVDAVRAHGARLQPGEILLVHPPWRDDVVTALSQSGVVPAGVEVTVAFAPKSNEPFPPLWVLRERDGLPLPRRLAEAVSTSVDVAGAPLRFEQLARSSGSFDLATLLPRATVTVTEADGDVTRCRFDGRDRHTCPGQPAWIHVGAEDVPVGGQTVRCIWAHPKTGAVVRVAFDDVPLLQTLTLSLGLSDTAAQTPGGAAVEAQLFVDDTLATTLRRRGQRGFGTATVDGGARRARVAVELRTPHDGQRHTCFQLVTAAAP